MKIEHDMHTHTIYSRNHHAKNTIEEMVEQARKMGLKAITISDHGRNHPFYGIRPKNLPMMRAEVDRLNRKYDDIDVYLGVEANLIGSDGEIDIGEEERKYCDVIYAGYHFGYLPNTAANFFSFLLPNLAAQFIPPLRKKRRKKNTDAYVRMCERYPLTMITHPGDKMPIDIPRLAEAAQEKDIILEINGHHDHMDADEIRAAAPYDVRFAVNSDAHAVSQIGRTGHAGENIRKAGIDPARVINVSFDDETGVEGQDKAGEACRQ